MKKGKRKGLIGQSFKAMKFHWEGGYQNFEKYLITGY